MVGAGQDSKPNLDRLTFEYPDAELVFGVVCAVGRNYRRVEKEIANLLKLYGYETTTIRLSSFLAGAHHAFNIDVPLVENDEYERIQSHMDVGNYVRDAAKAANFLALAAIAEINRGRSRTSTGLSEPKARHAHILVTLKRTEEIDILRSSVAFTVQVFFLSASMRASTRGESILKTTSVCRISRRSL